MAVCTADDRSAPEGGRPGPWTMCADARAECDAFRVGRRGRPPAVGTRACRRPAAAASGRAEPLLGRRRRAVAGERLGEDPRHRQRRRSGLPTVCLSLARTAWAPRAASASLAQRRTRGRPVGATGQPIRSEEPHGDRSTTARHAGSERVSGRATGRASGHQRGLLSGGTPSHNAVAPTTLVPPEGFEPSTSRFLPGHPTSFTPERLRATQEPQVLAFYREFVALRLTCSAFLPRAAGPSSAVAEYKSEYKASNRPSLPSVPSPL